MLDRDTILKLAREIADIESDHRWRESFEFDDFGVIRFAHAIASLVYEDAAKVCDRRVMGDNNREDEEAKCCAAAIRARGGEVGK